ncbi:hypothetical protein ACUN0C_01795 [Faunimonas sp. B44]|uniref:hypothetical protein n=1 Tax=Faunimonas sp. B44 TaxID=3461493 RepID=UPI0040442D9D
MTRHGPIAATALALLLGLASAPAWAQTPPGQGSPSMPAAPSATPGGQQEQSATERDDDDDKSWRDRWREWHETMRGWGGGPGMMGGWGGGPGGPGMMPWGGQGGQGGPGMMPWGGPNWGGQNWGGQNWGGWGGGPHSGMPMMMMVIIDEDGNGSLSYEEVERFHRRMFDYLDENKDGELSQDEIQNMMSGRFGGRR